MRVRLAIAVSATLVVAGVVAVAPANAVSREPLIVPATGLPLGMTPTAAQRATALKALAVHPNAAAPSLVYNGGPVISNPQVQSLLWTPDPTDATQTFLPEVAGTTSPNFDTYWAHLGNSAHVSWLKEYNPTGGGTGQSIGYGSFLGRTFLSPATAISPSTLVSQTQIEEAIVNAYNLGTIAHAAYDAQGQPNTVYAVYFPKNVVISMTDGVKTYLSGIDFCAFHGSVYVGNNTYIPYLVLPDPTSSGMNTGCGAGTAFASIEDYASHEYVEAITDPQVGWAASTTGPPLAWYDQTYGEIGDICRAGGTVITGSDDSALVTGTDGVNYTVQREWSNSLAACIAQNSPTVPAAASDLAAVAQLSNGNPNVHLTWSVPADGGSALVSQTVYRSTSAASNGPVLGVLSATATSLDDSSVTPKTTYYYRVVANNVYGPGTTSNAASVTPAAAPSGVATPTAQVFGSGGIQVNWSGVASDGGSPVTSWKIYRYDSTHSSGVYVGDAIPADPWFNDSGLNAGTSYWYAVSAVNAMGESQRSAISNAVAAQTSPEPPTNIAAAVAGPLSVVVTWDAPTSDGGQAITGYTVYRSEVSGDLGSQVATVQANTPLQFLDTGLTAGTTEYYTVTATNSLGEGLPGTASSVVVATTPDAPTNVVATPDNTGRVKVTWTAAATGGYPVTSYKVTSNYGDTCNSTVTTCTMSGLTVGLSYTFTVFANSDLGPGQTSAASNAVVPRTVPGAPRLLKASYAAGHKTTVSWSRPATTGGAAITGFYVRWSTNNKTWTGWVSVGNKVAAMHVGFKKGVKGYVQVVAANVAGRSAVAKLTVKPTK